MNEAEMNHLDHEDILIGRIAANEANAVEWMQFESEAAARSGAWERLARTLRDELQMRSALDEALATADHADVPSRAFESPVALIVRRIGWTGWAVAAMIAVSWVIVSVAIPDTARTIPADTSGGATLAEYANPEDAYRDYVRLGAREGRVLDELPMVMIDARPIEAAEGAPEGGPPAYEVYYIRQLLERARVNHAFEMNRDDRGRQVPVKVDFASFQESDL